MTLLLHRSDVGEDLIPPQSIPMRRRRLSAVVKPHLPRGRPCIVSVHRKGALLQPSDDTVRLRTSWKHTIVGPHDTIIITRLPLGGMGGGSSSSGGSSTKAIGGAVAMIAIAVAAPYLIGLMGGAMTVGGVTGGTLTLLGKVVATGIVAGAAYFISKATQPKANKETSHESYGVSGGGNLPKAGDRIPVHYGRVWHQPDLSQPDYFIYVDGADTDDQVLFKRVTLGAGRYKVHTVRVGQAIMWSEDGGLKAPFLNAQIEFITPGDPSTLVPGAVYSSDNVTGTELPRILDETNPWMGPYPVTEPGIKTAHIQLDFSLPQGAYSTHPKKSGQLPQNWGVRFEYAKADDDGNVILPWMELHDEMHNLYPATETAIRRTVVKEVTNGRWVVRAQNKVEKLSEQLQQAGVGGPNSVYWDGLRGYLYNEPDRPNVQEIALKISAEAMGSTMTFSDIWVETTSIIPVRSANGSWSNEVTREAVWCALDVLRNGVYGGAYTNNMIDLETFQYYSDYLTTNNTFDGTITGPVSVYEACATVLGVIRAEPILIGNTWSMTRDEPRQYQKHVISRRQIVKDTSGTEYNLDVSMGDSDVICEYYINGDSRKRGEVRATIGAETITPKRMQLFGVSTHAHAIMLARWYAASAYYRRETRMFTTELTGRIFGRNDPAMIEMWYLDQTQAAGVETASGYTLTLDIDFTLPPAPHLVLRLEDGREWGPVAITAGGARQVVVDAADAGVIAATTYRTLASLFGKPNRRMPITALVGTLSTLSRPYIIRTAKPNQGNQVQVSAVYDAPEVWSVLGESIPAAPPIKSVLLTESDLAPVLPWFKASVVQKAVSLMLDWSVGRARSSNRYQIQIAYGSTGGEWIKSYDGPQTEGSITVKYKSEDDPSLRVRARAINGQGIPGVWVNTTATLFKTKISTDSSDMDISIESLTAQAARDIAEISRLGEKSLRDIQKQMSDKIALIADAAATEAGTSYNRSELIKFGIEGRLQEAFVAISKEIESRISETELLYDQTDLIVGRLNDPISGTEAQVQQMDRVKMAIGYSYDGATAESSRFTGIEASLNNPITGLAAVATYTSEIKAAVGLKGSGPTASASKIENLSVELHGGTKDTGEWVQKGLITQASELTATTDKITARYGVALTLNGATGGFAMVGSQKNDGSGAVFNLEVNGGLIVDNTITGPKIVTNTLLVKGTANVQDLIIGGRHITDFAVTTSDGMTSSSGSATATVTVRNNGAGTPSRVAILASFHGGGNDNNTIYLNVYRGATLLRQQVLNYSGDKNLSTAVALGQTTILHIDEGATAGARTYTASCAYAGVSIFVIELNK